MGRKRRTAKDWATEFPDLEAKRVKVQDTDEDVLSCKYCAIELCTKTNASGRIREHLGSQRHVQRREESKKRANSGKQLTIAETQVRLKKKQEESETAVHDFVRALTYSGVALFKADTYLGKFGRKWVPSMRNLPQHKQLSAKYLDDIYHLHTDLIKSKLKSTKISLIVDESPDLLGRKAVNTLVSFIDPSSKEKSVLLIDTSIVKRCTTSMISALLADVLHRYEKSWDDVLAIASDSANYMKSLVNDIRASNNEKLLHVNDIAHLIHVTVNEALNHESYKEVREILLKMGNLFVHASTLENEFHIILKENEEEPRKPPQVVDHRWFSYFETAFVVQELWTHLIVFIESTKSVEKSNKVIKLRELLQAFDKQIIFTKINHFVDSLKPLKELQKTLSSGEPMVHKMHKILHVNLSAEMAHEEMSQSTVGLLKMLSSESQKKAKAAIKAFNETLKSKWKATCERNLEETVNGKDGIWKKCSIFDQSLKHIQSQDFNYYERMFLLVVSKSDIRELEMEFKQYLLEEPPANKEIKITKYWSSLELEYPLLSKVAQTFLGMPCGSLDAERSFSKFRDLLTDDRTRLTVDNLRKHSILYFNGDIEGTFDNY
jgi:hypothetical protein